jgi:hypothetical protein
MPEGDLSAEMKEKYKLELSIWEKIPQELRRPLIDALLIGVVAFDFLILRGDQSSHDVFNIDKAYTDFLQAALLELRKGGD